MKSTTGYVFILNGGAVSWNARKQPTVALPTEAEYMSLASAVQESEWLRQLNEDLLGVDMNPIHIHCDSQSALQLAANYTYHARTKHINIRYHFVREKLEQELITIGYVGTSDQIADVLTKALAPVKQKYLINRKIWIDFCLNSLNFNCWRLRY